MAVKLTNKPIVEVKKEESPPPEMIDFEVEPQFEILEPHKMVPFPAKNVEANKDFLFWEWQEKLVPEDWNHLVMYLFREWPYIDRQRVNPKASINIEVIGNPFSKNSTKFLEDHGSGKYKLLVNDSNKAVNGKGGTLGTVRFEVNDPEHPPVFVLEELVTEHPSNKGIVSKLVAEGKLTIEGKVMTQNNQGGGDNAALIALLTRMIERQSQQPLIQKDTTADNIGQMYVKASDSMMTMLKDQIKSDDPDKLIKMLVAVKEMMPKSETENSSLALIMKMQGDMAKVQSESQAARESMMLKMMEMMNAKTDQGDAEDKILARIATYKELFGGSGEGNTGKRSTLEVVLEHAAPAALKVMDIIGNVLSMQNFKAGLARNGQAPVVVNNPQQLPEAPQQQQTQQQGENVVEMPKAPEDELIQLIRGPAGPLIIGALERQENGGVFAESLEGMFGTIVYEKIAALGKEKLLAGMQAVPEFWNVVGSVPKTIEKFVDDFIAYGKEDEGEEDV